MEPEEEGNGSSFKHSKNELQLWPGKQGNDGTRSSVPSTKIASTLLPPSSQESDSTSTVLYGVGGRR